MSAHSCALMNELGLKELASADGPQKVAFAA